MSINKYRFGITKRYVGSKYRPSNIGICYCGQCVIRRNEENVLQCDKCGNDYFIDASGQTNKRFVIPYLEILRKDNRGFKVKRINLSIIYEEGEGIKVVKENLTRTMDYDIVDKRFEIYRGDVPEYKYGVAGFNRNDLDKANQYFFTQLEIKPFLDRVSNEVTRGLYHVADKYLSDDGWNKKKNITIGFIRLMKDYQWMQVLANAGIPQVDRFYTIASRYYNDKAINKEATKPHDILKVPKFMIKYIREDVTITRDVLKTFQGNFKNIDHNKFREIMSIVKDEGTMRDLSNSIEDIMQIHIDYGYTNIKKLVLYLFREVKLMQGIDSAQNASTYLRDYIRMSRAMELDWEKYPKSLKKEHDIVLMNYNLVNNNNNEQREFQLAVDKKSYQDLVYTDKKEDFAVIAPSGTEDLVKEGNQLSHCVASYVRDVASDRCKILFLRESNNIDKPLATIEVRGLNIRQARGFANRPLTEEQKEFVSKWAEEKGLVEAYY